MQALVAVTTQGFFVYRIYGCAYRPPSPFRLYSQPLSHQEEHSGAPHMGKEFIRITNSSVA
jgi:hypothetical protein